MRIERTIYTILVLVAGIIAIVQWQRARLFDHQNAELRLRLESLENEQADSRQITEAVRVQSERLRKQTSELMQLRNEVTQLRGASRSNETIVAENQRLQVELAGLKAAPNNRENPQGRGPAQAGHFPRENWSFAGYNSPEAALVSAIWSMKEGNPRSYLESLSPQEQQRLAQLWQDRTETEIAEKHKNDVASISGLRVLEQQNVAAGEIIMDVYLEGPGRMEKIRMNQVGQEWKFGGFIRDP